MVVSARPGPAARGEGPSPWDLGSRCRIGSEILANRRKAQNYIANARMSLQAAKRDSNDGEIHWANQNVERAVNELEWARYFRREMKRSIRLLRTAHIDY